VDSWQDVTGALVGGLALSLIQRRSTGEIDREVARLWRPLSELD
jgi:hypothetical protein